jgi:acetylornithine deacetylase/succinyl-diaminopimelate desuccinylase-like protein
VDVRIPPELRPIEVQRQLRAVMDATGYEYDVEMYTSKMGYEAKGIEPVVEVIEGTHQELFGEKTTPANTFRSSIWTDTNIYNEMGIPACKFGLGGGRFTTRSEQIDIDEIVRASKIYALSAATICNWTR